MSVNGLQLQKKVNQNKAMILPAKNMTWSIEIVPVKSQQQNGFSHFALSAYSVDVYIQAIYLRFNFYSVGQIMHLWGMSHPVEGIQGVSGITTKCNSLFPLTVKGIVKTNSAADVFTDNLCV